MSAGRNAPPSSARRPGPGPADPRPTLLCSHGAVVGTRESLCLCFSGGTGFSKLAVYVELPLSTFDDNDKAGDSQISLTFLYVRDSEATMHHVNPQDSPQLSAQTSDLDSRLPRGSP
jgi:hypothetical protein